MEGKIPVGVTYTLVWILEISLTELESRLASMRSLDKMLLFANLDVVSSLR